MLGLLVLVLVLVLGVMGGTIGPCSTTSEDDLSRYFDLDCTPLHCLYAYAYIATPTSSSSIQFSLLNSTSPAPPRPAPQVQYLDVLAANNTFFIFISKTTSSTETTLEVLQVDPSRPNQTTASTHSLPPLEFLTSASHNSQILLLLKPRNTKGITVHQYLPHEGTLTPLPVEEPFIESYNVFSFQLVPWNGFLYKNLNLYFDTNATGLYSNKNISDGIHFESYFLSPYKYVKQSMLFFWSSDKKVVVSYFPEIKKQISVAPIEPFSFLPEGLDYLQVTRSYDNVVMYPLRHKGNDSICFMEFSVVTMQTGMRCTNVKAGNNTHEAALYSTPGGYYLFRLISGPSYYYEVDNIHLGFGGLTGVNVTLEDIVNLEPSPAPAPISAPIFTPISTPGPSPAPVTVIVGGFYNESLTISVNSTAISQFIIFGNLNIQNATLWINGVVGSIIGNLDVAEGSTLVFNFSARNPSLNVSGCVRINGTLSVDGLYYLSSTVVLIQFETNCSFFPEILNKFPLQNNCVGEIKRTSKSITFTPVCQGSTDLLGPILGGVLGGIVLLTILFLIIVYNNKTLSSVILPWKGKAYHTTTNAV